MCKCNTLEDMTTMEKRKGMTYSIIQAHNNYFLRKICTQFGARNKIYHERKAV